MVRVARAVLVLGSLLGCGKSAPAAATTGDGGVPGEDDGCSQQLDEDSSHFWPVGVVVTTRPVARP
jgi:hypothetical protein